MDTHCDGKKTEEEGYRDKGGKELQREIK